MALLFGLWLRPTLRWVAIAASPLLTELEDVSKLQQRSSKGHGCTLRALCSCLQMALRLKCRAANIKDSCEQHRALMSALASAMHAHWALPSESLHLIADQTQSQGPEILRLGTIFTLSPPSSVFSENDWAQAQLLQAAGSTQAYVYNNADSSALPAAMVCITPATQNHAGCI